MLSLYLNNILLLLRNSNLKLADYNRASQLWAGAFFNGPTSFPDSRESWRTIIERVDLDDAHALRDWAPAAQRFVNLGFLDPDQIPTLSRTQLANLSAGEDFADLSVQLWRSAVITFTAPSTGDSNSMRFQSESVESLLKLIHGDFPVNVGGCPACRLGMPTTEYQPGLLHVIPVEEDEATPRGIRFAEDDEHLL